MQWVSLNPHGSWSCMWLTSMWDQRLPGQALPQRTLPLPPQCSCGSQAPGPLSLKRPSVNGFSHPDNQQLSTTCPLLSWEKDCSEKLFWNEDPSRREGQEPRHTCSSDRQVFSSVYCMMFGWASWASDHPWEPGWGAVQRTVCASLPGLGGTLWVTGAGLS